MKLTFNLTACGLALATLIACQDDSANFDKDGGGGSGASSDSSGTESSGSGNQTQGTVVINEIMYNPAASSDEAGEWVEIFNPGSEAVDLDGWLLRDNTGNIHEIMDLTIEPGGFVVLGRSASNNGGAPVDQAYGDGFKLANTADAVLLEDPSGEIIDEVSYDTVTPWPANAAGTSIELKAPDLDNSLALSWEHAVLTFGDGDMGTPGRANGGSAQIPGFDVDDVVSWHQPQLKTDVLFAPEDDLESYVLDQLATAQTSIRLAFFNVRLEEVRDLLVAKKNAGVTVEIILDKKQQDKIYNTMGEELLGLGVDVTMIENTSATDATMHNKFAIIDDHLVMTGSANYSYTALNVSDEDMIAFDDAALAARYDAEFDEILAGGDESSAPYAGAPAIQAWMGPEDSLAYKVVGAIEDAQDNIVVAMFQLNTGMIVDALIEAEDRGVNVVVILDEVQANQEGEDGDEDMAAAGVHVILADATGSAQAEMHSKFMVVDHETVVMGSYNWTNLGSFYNDENILVIEDAHLAARVEGKFAALLDTYNTSPSSVGLATGPQQVTFNITNVTMDGGLDLVIVGDSSVDGSMLDNGSVTVNVEAGTRVEYHYEVRENGTALGGETITHAFTVPYAAGPFVVTDAYVQ